MRTFFQQQYRKVVWCHKWKVSDTFTRSEFRNPRYASVGCTLHCYTVCMQGSQWCSILNKGSFLLFRAGVGNVYKRPVYGRPSGFTINSNLTVCCAVCQAIQEINGPCGSHPPLLCIHTILSMSALPRIWKASCETSSRELMTRSGHLARR